ncbi:MAG: HDOD domain-containing protein [Clostridiales bacterium]|nr:HDOD domain-containing protein [Clostridiales bacterium]
MSVMAYCFRHESAHNYVADAPSRLFDGVVSLPGLQILENIGLNAFTNGEALFVPVSHFSLLADLSLQCTQPPEKVIFLLDNKIPPEEPFLGCMRALIDKGFSFAIENVADFDRMHPVVEMCEYIKLGFRFNMDNVQLFNKISRKYRKHVFIATDVNSIEMYNDLQKTGFYYFEGRFYRLPVPKGPSTISPVKINRIQLLNTVRQPDFEIEEVVKIVERDPSISISLLKLVNSPHLGISQKIKGIQQAVALLGQAEVRKWVTTVIAGLLADDKPGELTRLALLRAKFAENMARHFEMAMQANTLFLMGLFSILDAALNLPMDEALKLIQVDDEVYDVLANQKGRFMPVLDFIVAYESADWNTCKNIMAINNIDPGEVFKAYIDTVEWYDVIVSTIIEEE